MSSANVIEFTDTNFESEALQSSVPVLVDFWAPWCGPCRMIGPIVEELAEEYAGKAKVGKVNVDDNPEIASRFKIQAIPALFVLKDGEVVDKVVGMTGKQSLASKLDAAL